jgi:hypothetical protein
MPFKPTANRPTARIPQSTGHCFHAGDSGGKPELATIPGFVSLIVMLNR